MVLQHELGKRRPFDAPEEEAWLNLQRSAAQLRAPFDRLFKQSGLTEATYNVLRILRGVHREPEATGEGGLPCAEIASRLVTRSADVTRLVDRLVREELALRRPDPTDRRRIFVHITDTGLERLAVLDEPVRELHRRQFGHLSESELRSLNQLLVSARRDPDPAA